MLKWKYKWIFVGGVLLWYTRIVVLNESHIGRKGMLVIKIAVYIFQDNASIVCLFLVKVSLLFDHLSTKCSRWVIVIAVCPRFVVRRLSSVERRPSSVIRRPSSVVRRPSSVMRRPSCVNISSSVTGWVNCDETSQKASSQWPHQNSFKFFGIHVEF